MWDSAPVRGAQRLGLPVGPGILGPSGEHLKGSPGVSVFGSLTKNPSLMLEALTRVRHPVTVMDQIVAVQRTRPRIVRLKAFCAA